MGADFFVGVKGKQGNAYRGVLDKGLAGDLARLALYLRGQGQRVKLATWPMTEAEAAAQARANQCEDFRFVEE